MIGDVTPGLAESQASETAATDVSWALAIISSWSITA